MMAGGQLLCKQLTNKKIISFLWRLGNRSPGIPVLVECLMCSLMVAGSEEGKDLCIW